VYAVDTDGTGFTVLHTFAGGQDGAFPSDAALILSGNTLYGTTSGQGHGNPYGSYGSVFSVNADGTGFTTLYNFSEPQLDTDPNAPPTWTGYTNSDGMLPSAGLILAGNTLYGTAQMGGSAGVGTVFKLSTDGTGFTTLYSFTSRQDPNGTNTDGAFPGILVLSGDTLYGTTDAGGSWAQGTVFSIKTDGTSFSVLHAFGDRPASDGFEPSGLVLLTNTLYGMTAQGGAFRCGTLFALNTDGTTFTNVHSFDGTHDGSNPRWLVLTGATLYGTALYNGASRNGTVFSISFPPSLTIAQSGLNVILSWPTIEAGFDYSKFTLQSTTNLAVPAAWTAVAPVPVAVNGRDMVTNPMSGPKRFYRLSQ
jgi:uncharacterized repeat protein (TIGR03803 family)